MVTWVEPLRSLALPHRIGGTPLVRTRASSGRHLARKWSTLPPGAVGWTGAIARDDKRQAVGLETGHVGIYLVSGAAPAYRYLPRPNST